MITRKEAQRLRTLITRRANAEVNDSWKGGGDPADWPEIEKALRDATKQLDDFIDNLTADDHVQP